MHPVVVGIAGLQAAQHQAGGVVVRLIHLDHLKAALQRGIALEVLLVFTPGGGGDGPQFAPGQRRLQQVGGIRPAGLIARADDRVRLVDKQQHRRRRLLHRLNDIFQPLLKLAFDPGTCLQQSEVEGAHQHRLQRVGDVAFGYAQRQAFHQGGLAHARLTDEDRVVFTPTGENIHHLADFRVASEHRVNLAVSGFGGDVESEFVQRVLQRRVEPIRIQFAARRTPHKFHVPAMGLRQRRFLLRWRTFVGLGIQQGAQAFQLTLAQR